MDNLLQFQNKSKGFTLLETLVALALVSLTLALPQVFIVKDMESLEEEWFLREFEDQYDAVQSYVIVSGSSANIHLYKDSRRIDFIIIGQPSHPLNKRLHLPQSLDIVGGYEKTIRLSGGKGNSDNLLRLIFQSDTEKTTYTLQMGAGQYVKERQVF